MNNFSELSLSSALQRNLDRNSFQTPTPVQAQAIPPAMEGRDVVATAQTGTGKTLAFLIPILESFLNHRERRGIQALILTPTRELALQIHEAFGKLAAGTKLRAVAVVGGLGEGRQLQEIRTGAHLVIATPGRLQDFVSRNLVNLSAVSTFVLDEADRMLDMGFLPSIRQIIQELPKAHQTLFFSATIEKSVAHLVESHVKNPVRIAIGAATKPVDQVDLRLYEIDQDRKLGLLTTLLEQEQGSFLVFARTKHGADRLSKRLSAAGIKTCRIHGDRTQNQRNQALNGFKDGSYRVMVATDVAARGIHVDGISQVVNYDLPGTPEDFIHRVGRTGRAGALGVASTFITKAQRSEVRQIERALGKRLTAVEAPAHLPRETKIVPPNVVVLPPTKPERRATNTSRFTPRRRRWAT